MSQEPSAQSLIELLREYYPSGIGNDDPRYPSSKEIERLTKQLDADPRQAEVWGAFADQLQRAFPDCEVVAEDLRPLEPCFRYRLLHLVEGQHGQEREEGIACILSLLAPVYAIYAFHHREEGLDSESWSRFPPLPPDIQTHEARLAALIESALGLTRLPNEVLFAAVPDLQPRVGQFTLRKARLVDCLFTPHRR
jgi:hypothetical protein